MRLFRRGTLLTAVAALVTTTAVATPQQVGAALPPGTLTNTVVFNNPHSDTGRYAIQNHIIDLIEGAAEGSTIRVTTYVFASTAYKNALIAAHRDHGIKVQVIADDRN